MNSNGLTGLTIGLLLSGTTMAWSTETPIGQVPVTEKSARISTPADAPVQVIVSRKDQSLRVFRGGEEIAKSRVSTGKIGHTTPTGIFSILEKRRKHFSNLYNSAPMPFMQRLTWSGIALHESNSVPSYPASHGCVRLPRGFAKKLFGLTERGAHVIIANRDAIPENIQHASLFQPQDMDIANKISSFNPGLTTPTAGLGQITLLSDRPTQDLVAHKLAKRLNLLEDVKKSGKPLRIFITRQAKGNLVREVQAMLNQLGFDAGNPDGLVGKATIAAIQKFKQAKQGSIESRLLGRKAVVDQVLLDQLYKAAGKSSVPSGHLFVRHKFKPLFDAPIQIKNANTPLGAHLFTASRSSTDEDRLEWLSVSLGDVLTPTQQSRLGVNPPDDESGLVASNAVLDRIVIPQDIREQINHLINNGSSLSISDRGFSRETGKGTDFIVLTKPTRPSPAAKNANKLAKRKSLLKRKKAAQRKKAAKKSGGLQDLKKPKRRTLFSIFRSNKTRKVANAN